MIEIVFSESACGGLKYALSFGKTKYAGSNAVVILNKHDGSTPSDEEIKQAQIQAEENERLEWERAVPMEGDAKDVIGFNLMLDIGDICDNDFIANRSKAIESLWSIYPECPEDEQFNLLENMREGIENIRRHITGEDEVRIWYSNQPNEMCGLYWFMSELAKLERQPKAVYIVKLPEYQYKDDNAVITHYSWGDISPSEWHSYTVYAQKTTDVFRRHCVNIWKTLQQENAPLRAMLNGKLQSVSESIYDCFIYREIEKQQDEFSEAMLIGNILGKYQLGIGDAWLARRIEHIIKEGSLEIAGEHPKDIPLYHRKLKKVR